MQATPRHALFLIAMLLEGGCGDSAPTEGNVDDAGIDTGRPATDSGTPSVDSGGPAVEVSSDGATGGVTVMISPRSSAVLVGRTLSLGAKVTGSSDTAVVFSVREASGCGTVSSTGTYTGPLTVPAASVCHVVATSHADPTASDTAALTITATASTGTPGVWEDVTPAGMHLDYDYVSAGNFGVQDIVVDPARPSDAYAFVCYQGVWKSTDYGVTWTPVSTGALASVLKTGRPWGAAIDPNPLRDPSTSPALYTLNGYGSDLGVFKSTNGGVDWVRHEIGSLAAGGDLYDMDIDPYDSNHIIGGFHEGPNVAESLDGGNTWRVIDVAGHSTYAFFIDTGKAATTRQTWLLIQQIEDGAPMQITRDGGAHFSTVESIAHAHGQAQIFQAKGEVFATGFGGSKGDGVYKSADFGSTWSKLFGVQASVTMGTATHLYVSNGGASGGGGISPNVTSAPFTDLGTWTPITTPVAMNNGAKRAAVTHDGSHAVILSGNWTAGIWRFVEP